MSELTKKIALSTDITLPKHERTTDDYVDMIISHYNSTTNEKYIKMNRGDISKEVFITDVKNYLNKIAQAKSDEFKNEVILKVKSFLWGFSVLDEIINNALERGISDIKIVTHDNIRLKQNGKRIGSGIKFRNKHEFMRFVSAIATRNSINLSTLNATQTFTDNDSHPALTLRFTIATKFLTSTQEPVMHIRVLPKEHRSLSYFEKRNLLISNEKIQYFKKRITECTGILIVGKTGSGKTIFYNGLMDYIPHDKSILVIQENEELNNRCKDKDYIPHPEMIFLHTVYASGEGKVEYNLKDLARMGLLFDVDYFGIGEVKGGEAKYLLNCIMTGSIGMCTSHGSSIEDGMDKVADYITYDTDYKKDEALEMLQRLNTVVYVEDFEIKNVAEVTGFDKKNKKILYNIIDF